MERAGEAMQQIHGKLNIDKVDETMYGPALLIWHPTVADSYVIGRSFENNTHWARRLPQLLPAHLSASLSTRQSWRTS